MVAAIDRKVGLHRTSFLEGHIRANHAIQLRLQMSIGQKQKSKRLLRMSRSRTGRRQKRPKAIACNSSRKTGSPKETKKLPASSSVHHSIINSRSYSKMNVCYLLRSGGCGRFSSDLCSLLRPLIRRCDVLRASRWVVAVEICSTTVDEIQVGHRVRIVAIKFNGAREMGDGIVYELCIMRLDFFARRRTHACIAEAVILQAVRE